MSREYREFILLIHLKQQKKLNPPILRPKNARNGHNYKQFSFLHDYKNPENLLPVIFKAYKISNVNQKI